MLSNIPSYFVVQEYTKEDTTAAMVLKKDYPSPIGIKKCIFHSSTLHYTRRGFEQCPGK
jgi:hypothetical protein